MKRYLYSPYELAIIFQYHGINIVRMTEILDNIYRYDNAFVQCEYRRNQKKLMFDVMDKMNYLNNQEQFDLEKDDVDKDLSDFGLVNSNGNCDSEEAIDHLIFKELRIRILYINKKGYAKMKLRTLLSELGYKRRSPVVINYIFDCLLFYHIAVFLKDNTIVDEKTTNKVLEIPSNKLQPIQKAEDTIYNICISERDTFDQRLVSVESSSDSSGISFTQIFNTI